MKMKHLTPLFALLLCQALSAQVKIGDNPQNIDPASLLELESTEQVLVITRVTTAQMEAIAPSEGALVYNTDEACLFYYSQRWINLCEALGLSFTNEAIVNRDSTIIITEFEDRFNFEVGRIRGGDDTGEFNNIIDFSVTSQDIQNNAINAAKLAPNSVGTEEIEDNAVTGAEIDLNLVRVSTFDNDAGYLITADLVSQDPGNDILEGSVNGVFYDNPDGVVGNEVTGPTDATLVLSGTGIDVDPLTLDVADGAIGTSELADLGVQTGDIAQDAITADKIDASVAGTGLVQNADGALEVDVTEFQGDGTLSSPGGSITLGGIPENALFEDVDIDVAIPELISGESGNSVTTGPDGGLFATDDQDASEVSFDDSAAQLGATLVQDAIDALAASNASDLDTDPTNEFSLTGTGLPGNPGTSAGQTYVDISAGQLFAWDGAVWIAVGGTNAVDNDPDPQNELQDLDFTAGIISLSGDPTQIPIDLSGYDSNAADDFDGEWTSVLNRPAGLDDGDDNTTYTAGAGLLLTGTEFSVDNSSIAPDWTNLVNIPPNLDTDSTDDFDGEWTSILNRPAGLDDGDSHIGNFDLTIDANRTHNLNGNNLVFTGSGSVGIGTGAASPQDKLDVDGQIRARNGFAASEGSVGNPGYGFYTNGDTDTGIFRISEDQLGFTTGGIEAARIDLNQQLGIGVTAPLALLHVGGTARFDGQVTLSNGTTLPDYVFQKYFSGSSDLNPDYKMPSLDELKSFLERYHHLPGVTSASEVEAQGGIVLDETITQNLEKIEELFLYTIEQEDKIEALQKENADLSSDLEALKERMSRIEYLLLQKKEE